MDSIIGSTIDEKYKVVSQLGSGGLGTVYKAVQIELGRDVAIKILHDFVLTDQDHLQRFEREARILAVLQHPNIVQVFSFGLIGDTRPYMAIEYLEGQSLDKIIQSEPVVDWKRVAKIMIQACEAVAYAHSKGVIHRDLKPQNIMILQSPTADFVKILDFGLSRLVTSDSQAVQHLTKTGFLIGSVNYMSPELCHGQKADEKADVYSMGCTLYECLSGHPPLESEHPISVIHKQMYEMPQPLRTPEKLKKANIPADLELVVFKALQKSPADRFQSMDEFASALKLVLDERTEDLDLGTVQMGQIVSRTKSTWIIVSSVIAFIALFIIAFAYAKLAPRTKTEAVVAGASITSREKARQYVLEGKKYKAKGLIHNAESAANHALNSIAKPMDRHDCKVAMEDLSIICDVAKILEGIGAKASLNDAAFIETIKLNDQNCFDNGATLRMNKAMVRIYTYYGAISNVVRPLTDGLNMCRTAGRNKDSEEILQALEGPVPDDLAPKTALFRQRLIELARAHVYAIEGNRKKAENEVMNSVEGVAKDDLPDLREYDLWFYGGQLLKDIKSYDKAELMLQHALKIAEKVEGGYKGKMSEAAGVLANLYEREGKPELAKRVLRESMTKAANAKRANDIIRDSIRQGVGKFNSE